MKIATIMMMCAWLLTGCVSAPEMTYEEAKARAVKDEAGLTEEQNKSLSEGLSAALDGTVEKCGIEKESFSIIMRLNGSGKIKEIWSATEDKKIRCVMNEFMHAKLFDPGFSPFFVELEWVGGESVTGKRVEFTNLGCNPAVKISGVLKLENGKLVLQDVKMELKNNPAFDMKTITVRNARLKVHALQDDHEKIMDCPDGEKSYAGWDCGHEGDLVKIERPLSLGEVMTITRIELPLDLAKSGIDQKDWVHVSVMVESDVRLGTTDGHAGLM